MRKSFNLSQKNITSKHYCRLDHRNWRTCTGQVRPTYSHGHLYLSGPFPSQSDALQQQNSSILGKDKCEHPVLVLRKVTIVDQYKLFPMWMSNPHIPGGRAIHIFLLQTRAAKSFFIPFDFLHFLLLAFTHAFGNWTNHYKNNVHIFCSIVCLFFYFIFQFQ